MSKQEPEPSMVFTREPGADDQILWTKKLPIDKYERLQATTQFFQFVLISTADQQDVRLHIDTHKSMWQYYPYQFEIRFTGDDAKAMALRFTHSLKQLEQVALDYIKLVQDHPEVWIEKQRKTHEDDQPDDVERKSRQGS